jgi:hypothetical protein
MYETHPLRNFQYGHDGIFDRDNPHWVRVVDIAEQSKRQLLDDPNFREYRAIPDKGITMTLPALLAAPHIFRRVRRWLR